MTSAEILSRLRPDQDLQWFLSQCEEVGDCLEWQGPYTSNGYPQVWTNRENGTNGVVLARRAVAAVAGLKYRDKQPLRMRCRNKRCLDPEHMLVSSTKEIAVLASRRGAFNTQARRMAISRGKRAASPITPDMRQQILDAEYGTLRSVCDELGVKYSTGKSIRSIRARSLDQGANMWMGLL